MNQNEVLHDPCPDCGKVGFIGLMHRQEDVKVRGQVFNVSYKQWHCSACDTIFSVSEGDDPLEIAYRAYRETNGLLQPEILKKWRQDLGLKQAELASLLGWSTATVSRYENGALQDDAHDRAMRAAMSPGGLSELVAAAQKMDSDVLKKLRIRVDELLGSSSQLTSVVSHRLSNVSSVNVNWRKVEEAVAFFSSGQGVARTKLNKLLFYVDFLHQKIFDSPVTGLVYVRLQHGPVPKNYELIYSAMAEEGILSIKEEMFGEYMSYVHKATRGADISIFSTSEKQALVRVLAEFERCSATEISERSHSEDAWKYTATGQEIALSYAETLSLGI